MVVGLVRSWDHGHDAGRWHWGRRHRGHGESCHWEGDAGCRRVLAENVPVVVAVSCFAGPGGVTFSVAFSAYDMRAVVPVVVLVAGRFFADFVLLGLAFVGLLVVIVAARGGAVAVLLRAAVAWALALLVCVVGPAPFTGVVSASVPFALAVLVVAAVAAPGTVPRVISVTISASLPVVAAAALALSGAGAGAGAGTGTASTGGAPLALFVFSVAVSGGLAGVRSVTGITLGCAAGSDCTDGHGAVALVAHDHVGELASLTRVIELGPIFVRCCR